MKLGIGKLIDDEYVIYLQYADEIAVGRHISPTADKQYAVIDYDPYMKDFHIAMYKTREKAENDFREALWGDKND